MNKELEWPKDLVAKGDDNRRKALQRFDISPLMHLALLPGQELTSYLNQTITTHYYQFLFTEKSSGRRGTFYCGDSTAEGSPQTAKGNKQEGWLKLAGLQRLQCINPLSIQYISPANNGRIVAPSVPITDHERIVAALQLVSITAISVWKMGNKGSILATIYRDLCSKKLDENQLRSKIKSINTIISGRKELNEGETFQQYLVRLQVMHPAWCFRRFNSELLRMRLLTHPEMATESPIIF
ncbi:hypothetical protein WCU61_11910 [Pectobacterium versatile]|uniref:hypothetical protein n=1 Tax=Pectobacterium versatile TaxID=2488639 RepID=UPI003019DE59